MKIFDSFININSNGNGNDGLLRLSFIKVE